MGLVTVIGMGHLSSSGLLNFWPYPYAQLMHVLSSLLLEFTSLKPVDGCTEHE